MKPSRSSVHILASLVVALISNKSNILAVNAIGYKPDPTHRYEHKEDLEKLLHPNNNINKVGVGVDSSNVHSRTRTPAEDEDGDDVDTATRIGRGNVNSKRALLTGIKTRPTFVPEIQNVVTNILEASETVERESVVKPSTSSAKIE